MAYHTHTPASSVGPHGRGSRQVLSPVVRELRLREWWAEERQDLEDAKNVLRSGSSCHTSVLPQVILLSSFPRRVWSCVPTVPVLRAQQNLHTCAHSLWCPPCDGGHGAPLCSVQSELPYMTVLRLQKVDREREIPETQFFLISAEALGIGTH